METPDATIRNQDPVVRQAVIHAFTKAISTVWLVLTPICGVSLILGTSRMSIASLNTETNPGSLRVPAVLFIRNYSMKRTIVKEGKRNSDGETPPVTPTTEEAGSEPQTVEEKRRPASDLEKGLDDGDDASVDVKDESGQEYPKKS